MGYWIEAEDMSRPLVALGPDSAAALDRAVGLLAACRAVLECLGRTLAPDYLPETRELLRAAIAKAEGE